MRRVSSGNSMGMRSLPARLNDVEGRGTSMTTCVTMPPLPTSASKRSKSMRFVAPFSATEALLLLLHLPLEAEAAEAAAAAAAAAVAALLLMLLMDTAKGCCCVGEDIDADGSGNTAARPWLLVVPQEVPEEEEEEEEEEAEGCLGLKLGEFIMSPSSVIVNEG